MRPVPVPMTASVTSTPAGPAPVPPAAPLAAASLLPAQRQARPVAVQVLAAYPHIARCAPCRGYAEDALATFLPGATLQATLAHHESGHRHDSLFAASEYFGIDDTLLTDEPGE